MMNWRLCHEWLDVEEEQSLQGEHDRLVNHLLLINCYRSTGASKTQPLALQSVISPMIKWTVCRRTVPRAFFYPSGAAVNSPTSRAAVMTSCSLCLSEEICFSAVFFICWNPDIVLKKSQHLKQLWSWYSLISSPTVQASALQDGKGLAFEQAWNLDTLRSRALVRFGLWWTPQALLGFHLRWTSQRKPHDYAFIKRDGPHLGLLWLKASEAPQSCSATPSSPQSLHSSSHVVHLASILSIASIQRRMWSLYPLQKHGQRSKEDTKRHGSTSV